MQCPECNPCNCPDPDFIERNGTWLLGVVGMIATCFGGVLTFLLKSRCHHLKFACIECDRVPAALDADVKIETTSSK